MDKKLDSTQKAFSINLDSKIYGTFAEIGAGQEVARYFFRAGGAAGTIAKSMSAYDMTVSDDIYGKSGRYVSQERLQTMLKREFDQLVERLEVQRGEDTKFFAFADTVAAKSFKYSSDCHGWLGVRFQHEAKAERSQVIIHVRMLDNSNLQQQEALGIVGVNLIYACYHHLDSREAFIESLVDNISLDRIKIDLIDVKGPAFNFEDSRLWPLELVKKGYCEAVMFNKDGDILQPKDALYKKNLMVCRGSYRPPTLVNLDMLICGEKEFKESLDNNDNQVLVLPEISMNKLKERGEVVSEDFLARIDLLSKLGQNVLISSFETYGDLNCYLSFCTNSKISFVLGFYNLSEVFDPARYESKPGGYLQGIGEFVGHRTSLYLYPAKDEKTGSLLTSNEFNVDSSDRLLLSYLESKGLLFNLKSFNQDFLHIWSRTVLKMIQSKQSGWEQMVPKELVEEIKNNCLFDYPCDRIK